MIDYRLTLDMVPMPTTNRNMIIQPKGGRPMVIKTSKAKKWMEEAVWKLKSFRARYHVTTIRDAVAVSIDIYRPTSSGDVDNYAKGIMDALQASGFISNDRLVTELHLRKYVDRNNPRYELHIKSIEPQTTEHT